MGRRVAIKDVDSAGGPQISGTAAGFTIDGKMPACVTDPVTPHGLLKHAAPVMATGAPNFIINGQRVCREGDLADCGHPTTGTPNFTID